MIHLRVAVHTAVLLISLVLGAWCLLPAGRSLARSVPFVVFLSLFAITYSAVGSLEALHAGRKADPDDPT